MNKRDKLLMVSGLLDLKRDTEGTFGRIKEFTWRSMIKNCSLYLVIMVLEKVL